MYEGDEEENGSNDLCSCWDIPPVVINIMWSEDIEFFPGVDPAFNHVGEPEVAVILDERVVTTEVCSGHVYPRLFFYFKVWVVSGDHWVVGRVDYQ